MPKFLYDLVIGFIVYKLGRSIVMHYMTIEAEKYVINPSSHWLWKHIINSERKAAIWLHYQYRAQGLGHKIKSVIDCQEGHCTIV